MKEKFEVKISENGDLSVLKEGKKIKVTLKPCFPWSAPGQYMSLVDKDGAEVAYVEKLKDLKVFSRDAVVSSLEEASFCFVIEEIESVEDEFELRRWWVRTRQGKRQFQTKLLDWPREVPGGGLLIQDLYGDLFFIPETSDLPESSRQKLLAFLD